MNPKDAPDTSLAQALRLARAAHRDTPVDTSEARLSALWRDIAPAPRVGRRRPKRWLLALALPAGGLAFAAARSWRPAPRPEGPPAVVRAAPEAPSPAPPAEPPAMIAEPATPAESLAGRAQDAPVKPAEPRRKPRSPRKRPRSRPVPSDARPETAARPAETVPEPSPPPPVAATVVKPPAAEPRPEPSRDWGAHMDRADAARRGGDAEVALQLYAEAAEADPHPFRAEALLRTAQLLGAKGRFQAALSWLERPRSRGPLEAELLALKASLELEEGRLSAARKTLDSASGLSSVALDQVRRETQTESSPERQPMNEPSRSKGVQP